jgi:Fur family ferric uptake transcriptional regulator
MDAGIEDRQNAVAERLGFEIRDHSMVLYGKCKRNPCPYRKKVPGSVRKVSDRGHHS